MVALHDATDRATHEFAATAISGPRGMLIDLRSERSGNHISTVAMLQCCQGPLLQASESKAQRVPPRAKVKLAAVRFQTEFGVTKNDKEPKRIQSV